MPAPPINHVVLASGAVVAVSVIAVAAAVAIYESPEVRRYAEDVRRRIAIAFNPPNREDPNAHQEPRFNRPEDADGFFESRNGAEPGVDADEETKKRQREELMYWNSVRLQKQQEEEQGSRALTRRSSGGSTFDDFLKQDETAETGTYIYNTGTDLHDENSTLRRRGEPPVPAPRPAAVYANPFADENHIFHDDFDTTPAAEDTLIPPPVKDLDMSDIYSATTREEEQLEQRQPMAITETLIDFTPDPVPVPVPESSHTETTGTMDHEYETAAYPRPDPEHQQEAYASIQAWAQDSSRDFYSPLPVTPAGPISEPEMLSDGEMTPTDSISLVGSGEDIAADAVSSRDGDRYDVMSESDGMMTPASWSEVGSVISETEGPMHA